MMFPPATDFDTIYIPAVRALLAGVNPFGVFGFYNPPWALVVLAPFVALPYDVGRVLLTLCAIGSLALVAKRLGASPWGMLAIVLSPLAFNSIAWGNVEWITLLGLALPLPVGLVLLSIKPQETLCVMAFLLIEEWRARGLRRVLLALFPVTLLFLGSFALYGFYPLGWIHYANEAGINFSFYPYTIPVGVGLMLQAVRTRRLGYALAASPMFFATLSPQVWLVEFLAIAALTPEVCAASLSAWGVVAMVKGA